MRAFRLSEKAWSNLGFSLIELLVVVAVLGLLMGGALAAYSGFNKEQSIKQTALNIKADFAESQNKAISGFKASECRIDENSDNVEDYELLGEYIIFEPASVNPTSYIKSQVCQTAPGQITSVSPIEPVREQVNLPSGITVHSLICGSTTNGLVIGYDPLKAVRFYNDSNVPPTNQQSCGQAVVVITDQNVCYAVRVNNLGQTQEEKVTC